MGCLTQFFSVKELKLLEQRDLNILRDAIQNFARTSSDIHNLIKPIARTTYDELIGDHPVAPAEEPDPP